MRARPSDKPREKGASTQRRRLQEITGTAVECGSIGRQVEMTRSLEAGRRCSGISCSLLKTPAAAGKQLTVERDSPESQNTARGRHTHPVPSDSEFYSGQSHSSLQHHRRRSYLGTHHCLALCVFLTFSSENGLFSSESKTKALIKPRGLLALFYMSIWEKGQGS